MHWTLLFIAAAFEIVWAVGLKSTAGFTRLWPSVGVGAALAASVGLLALAARGLPIGTAYAVWTGIGAAGTAVAGMVFFGVRVLGSWLGFAMVMAASMGTAWSGWVMTVHQQCWQHQQRQQQKPLRGERPRRRHRDRHRRRSRARCT
jgi:quaternary ammonium compound-resistance protein SugE